MYIFGENEIKCIKNIFQYVLFFLIVEEEKIITTQEPGKATKLSAQIKTSKVLSAIFQFLIIFCKNRNNL